jgi:electron transport complex protein RnfC
MRQARTFPRGGIEPPDRTALSAGIPIRNACVPAAVVIPLALRSGFPGQCLVRPGDTVAEGAPIGRSGGPDSIAVHASIPGRVREIGERSLADGSSGLTVLIELEGEFAVSGQARPPAEWEKLSIAQLRECIREHGAADLSAFHPGADFLAVNAVESEPYITAAHRLLVERAPELVTGVQIVQRILQPAAVMFGVEAGRSEALECLGRAVEAAGLDCRIEPLQLRYPQGAERPLLEALLGRSRAASEPGGAAVIDLASLYAIYEAVVLGKPLLERIVTVTGQAVRRPANLKVRLGTRIGDLIEECGGFSEPPARLLAGGPMMGSCQSGLEAPVTRELAGLIALSRSEVRRTAETPCIGCGRCVSACPWSLAPVEIYKALEHRRFAEAEEAGLAECTECGCCAYVCPARIPLAAGMRRGKSAAARG